MIINSRISDGAVIDVDQEYDSRVILNETFPDGTIPLNDRPRYYRRIDANTVTRLTDTEIEAIDRSKLEQRLRIEAQALVASLIADIQALPAGPQKQILTQMLQLIRKLTLLSRLE